MQQNYCVLLDPPSCVLLPSRNGNHLFVHEQVSMLEACMQVLSCDRAVSSALHDHRLICDHRPRSHDVCYVCCRAQVRKLQAESQDAKAKLDAAHNEVLRLEEQLQEAEAAAERLNDAANLGEDADEENEGEGDKGAEGVDVGNVRQTARTPAWLLPVIGLVVGSNLLTLLLAVTLRPRVAHKPSVHLN